jgi:peptidyl-prolyl cis-trans isomerase A (cyclophilin A)
MTATFTTSQGTFKIKLFADKAPKTVANFAGLAEGTQEWTDPKTRQKVKRPYYDGLVFHRVIAGFMIQGGCPMGNGMGGPGYQFADEFGPGLAPVPTPTAASSSSRWRQRPGSTDDMRSSAR